MTEQIILGSGDLYITDFDSVIPNDSAIEVAANMIGRILGGATLEYKPTEYEVSDDGYNITKRFVITEEVLFKSGILTWNLKTLSDLITSGTFTDADGIRTLKLGGHGARQMKEYLIHFVHTESDGNKFRITIVATNSSGFSLAFAKDKETVIDAEFKAKGQDADGTLVKITESYTAE